MSKNQSDKFKDLAREVGVELDEEKLKKALRGMRRQDEKLPSRLQDDEDDAPGR